MAQGLFNLKQVVQAVQQGGWNGQKPPAVEYLVVAGGGAGGGGYGTGGGAGGLLQGVDPVPVGQTLVVTVGAGGTGNGNALGNNGNNSVFGQISATGGGAGVSGYGARSTAGGSGGGSAGNTGKYLWGEGIVGQGNQGGNGGQETGSAQGGGGGAGTRGVDGNGGNNGGAGGVGVGSVITGTVTAYAGGGGGGTYNSTAGDQGIGGAGGGGSAGTSGGSNVGANGSPNTGGGGGGCSYNSGAGGSIPGGTGGSGFVSISYPDIYAAATTVNATASTSGSGSISYTGSTSVYLSTATNTSSFAFAGGDFTVEFWLYINSSGSYTLYDSRALGSNDTSPTIYLNSNVLTYFTSGGDRIVGGSVLSNTTWYHIAVARIGTSTKMYVNGTQTGSTYTDTNTYINTSGRPFVGSGSVVAGQNPLNGYLTNVRVVKGVGVYTGNFTSPTAPLQATQPAGTNIAAITSTSTSLLLNAVSGGYLADSSTFGNTFSVSTAPTWNQLSPFTVTGYKNRVYTWTTSGTITF